jgi:hypothetical protein
MSTAIVAVSKTAQIPLRSNPKMLCFNHQEVNDVVDVEHNLLDDTKVTLSCGCTRGMGSVQRPGLIGLEQMHEPIASVLWPWDPSWPETTINQTWEVPLNRRAKAKRALEAELQAEANRLLIESGHGNMVIPEFDDDHGDHSDFADGYQFQKPEAQPEEGSFYEGLSIVRDGSVSWDNPEALHYAEYSDDLL